ncbi:alpha/beta hydrolase [Yinghuangia seranimata]|uniref:alpha/beta hydrolase n=1 Tax=Yinghuangia seranimata TaxID=408067 RepID=UPI00248BFFD3|nr:alpha/beta hydrolase [Yinghuangia seranimata]MDI2132776.1 alpha/beta hydrolase [Yinghuangia seranimata]
MNDAATTRRPLERVPRRRPWRTRRAVVAVTALALAAALTGAAPGDGTGAPDAQPEGPAAPGVTWGGCPTGTPAAERCGTVRVPLDHDHPNAGPAIQVGVSRSLATGGAAERQGILLINFGGPGATAVGSAAAFAHVLPEPVRRAYDVVGFDPRGRGTSTRLDCLDLTTFARAPKPDTARTDAEGQRAIAEAAHGFADGCRRGAPQLLPYLTTRQIAGDLDAVRAAFGEQKINYLGYSYGTYLGAVYGQRYPDRVRRMLLDSVVDPTQVWYATGFAQARAFWLRWHDWADWVADHDTRYGLGTSREAVLARWNEAREALAAKPADGVFGGTEFDLVTISNLYSDRQWPTLATAVAAYENRRDAAPLRDLKGPTTPDDENFESVFQAVTCADAPSPADPAVFAADTARLKDQYGYLGADIASAGACLYLQSNTAPPTRIDGAGLPGVLMIEGTRDPATPYAGAVRMRAALPSARLVTVEGSGNHGQFIGGGACVDDAGTAYLARGVLPAADTTCPALPPPDPAKHTATPRRFVEAGR